VVVFVSGKHFESSLIFASKSLPEWSIFQELPLLLGGTWLYSKILLGWTGLSWTNTGTTTFSTMTFSITTLSIMSLSIMALETECFMVIVIFAECHFC
jgi:hypothetical protein